MSRELLDREQPMALVAEQALADAAAHWGLLLSDLNESKSRTQSDIRAIAYWTLRERYAFSYPEIAQMFPGKVAKDSNRERAGRREHSGVMHQVKRVQSAVARFDAGSDDWLGRIARSILVGAKVAAE